MEIKMKHKIKVLFVSAEISSYASAGGLGEVGRSLPEALLDTGMLEVRRVMPLYKCISKKMEYVTDFPVPVELGYETCILKQDIDRKELPTYFLQNDRYFYRDHIYTYKDDGFRFFFFCMAVVEMLKRISFRPDIVHINDWHTGFLALLLKKEFPEIKSIYTIHNISYHGFIPPSYLSGLITEEESFQLGYPEWLNFMKAGIKYADLVTTVSPGYAKEIKQEAFRCGMSSLLEQRENELVGILNGIDTKDYNPNQVGVLDYPYDFSTIELKQKNRSLLRSEFGLPDTDIPLIAMITRLDYSKGIDLLLKAISYSDFSKFQLIILGSGSFYYQDILSDIIAGYRDKIAVEFHYTPELAKRIYAAADIYLMPSLSEPCGLGQLFAMRYGAVPVVNPVGGLKDTVVDDELHPENSNGFYMEDWSGEALSRAINRAVDAYATPDWSKYIANGMKLDSSWRNRVSEYLTHYEDILVRMS
jgi:starch synthase